MFKSAIYITIMMLISKVLALGKEILLAEKYGTSYITDAYMIAISLVNVLFSIYANGFANSYLPVFMRIKQGEEKNFFNNTFSILIVISLVFSTLCFIFSDFLVDILAPGFNMRGKQLTGNFIRIIVFYLPFYTASSLFSAHLSVKERFLCSNFCEHIVINILLIISIIISSHKNINFLIYGYLISMCISSIIQYFNLKIRNEIDYKFQFNLKNSEFKQLSMVAIPFGLSSLISKVNIIIDKIFSSSLGEGITSAINFADKLQTLPYTLIISTIIVVYRPKINKFFSENNKESGIFYARIALAIALYISLPIVVVLFNFSIPIIRFLLERGAFNENSTVIVANSLLLYAIGIPFYSCREIASNILIANYKQNKILKNIVTMVILNIVFNYIFIKILGYKGLALATSLSGVIGCFLMNYDLIKLNIFIFKKNVFIDIIKILISSIISCITCINSYSILYSIINPTFSLLISLFTFGFFYLIFTILFKVEIIILLIDIFYKNVYKLYRREK